LIMNMSIEALLFCAATAAAPMAQIAIHGRTEDLSLMVDLGAMLVSVLIWIIGTFRFFYPIIDGASLGVGLTLLAYELGTFTVFVLIGLRKSYHLAGALRQDET